MSLSTVNPSDALLVEWTHDGRTLQVPPSKQTLDYWYGVTVVSPAPNGLQELYTLGEESRQLRNWWIVAGATPSVLSFWSPAPCGAWSVSQISATTCRITGCVQTYYDIGSMDTGIRPYQAGDYQIRGLWQWQCDFVSGVQQAVTCTLLDGYRYEWDTALLDWVVVSRTSVGAAPVVTVTIAP